MSLDFATDIAGLILLVVLVACTLVMIALLAVMLLGEVRRDARIERRFSSIRERGADE